MILQRYIHRELVHKLAWITGLLILVFASNKFVGFLADAAEGMLPGDMVFMMLGYKMVAMLPGILPVSILVSILLVFSRMASDRELVILAAAGVGRFFQVKIVLRFAIVFCLFVALITLYLAPWAEQRIHELKQRARQESDISSIKPGQFKEFSRGDRVVYVENPAPDNIAMQRIFLQVRQEGKLGVLTSDSAHFKRDKKSGNKYIVFSAGRRYVGAPGLLDYQITQYEKYALLTETATVNTAGAKMSALSTALIIGSDNTHHQAELQWRLSLIISCLLLPLLGLLLIRTQAVERRYQPFIIGILIYLVYSNLLGIAQTLLKREVVPFVVGVWWVHLLLLIIIAILYYLPRLHRVKSDKDRHQFIPAG